MKTQTQQDVLLAVAKTIKGTTFVGIRNYQNSQGEVSNQTIVAGITYENALQSDFITLQENKNIIFEELTKKHSFELVTQAYENVFTSLEKRLSSDEVKQALREQNDQTIKKSDAQKDAFIHLAKGVKMNKESEEILIFGLVVRKEVLKAVEYKQVNSKELTIVQNKIKKLCDFKTNKYRSYTFNKIELKMQGVTI